MTDHAAKRNYSIAVDFDGVLHSYTSLWVAPDVIPDPPVDGAIEWLNEIGKDFTVIIFTTRGQTLSGRLAVRAWLRQHGADPDVMKHAEVTAKKSPALVYIDDRAWRFEGPGTFPTRQQIHEARPWNKPKVRGRA